MTPNLLNILQITAALKPQSIASATATTSAYVEARMFERIAGTGVVADLLDTKTLTVQLMQATDVSGGGAKVLGTAVVGTAVGSVTVIASQEARAQEFDSVNGFHTVAVRITHNHGGVRDCAAMLIRNSPVRTPASDMGIA